MTNSYDGERCLLHYLGEMSNNLVKIRMNTTMPIWILLLSLALAPQLFAQGTKPDIKLRYPVQGTLGVDYFLVNHVDHDSTAGIGDYQCGVQTYDGHQGTDFVIRSFRQMDSGVTVVAAAYGVVSAVVDGNYDRNKFSDKSRGFGNYISITHGKGYATNYAHIRKGSAVVKVGDVVEPGQKLALVGSAGNSEDPHVHFELWKLIDPFSGQCNDQESFWVDQSTYSTRYNLIDADLTNWPPSLDTLRERPPTAGLVGMADTTITFWSLQQGIKSTDTLTVLWLQPNGSEWFMYQTQAGVNSHYYYFWTWINRPTINGTFTVKFSHNGTVISQKQFEVSGVTMVDDAPDARPLRISISNGNLLVEEPTGQSNIQLFQVNGRLLNSSSTGVISIPRNTTCFARITVGGKVVTVPLFVN